MRKPPFHSSSLELLETRIAPAALIVQLYELDGSNGFQLSGVAGGDGAGFSVSGLGDVNGDGRSDILVGAERSDLAGSSSGSVYVVFGRENGSPAALDLSTLDGATGFRVDGSSSSSFVGKSASGIGDFNNDGFNDFLVGAPGKQAFYVVFGRATFPASFSVDSMAVGQGFKITGSGIGSGIDGGSPGEAAGDVNGDGIPDLIVGQFLKSPAGEATVLYGSATPFPATVNLDTIAASAGFHIIENGRRNTFTGFRVSTAGDFNGDGVDDVLLGSRNEDWAYVVFGKAGGHASAVQLTSADPTTHVRFIGEFSKTFELDRQGDFAEALGPAGDVNNDGFDDIVIGDVNGDPNNPQNLPFFNSGAAYIIFGRASWTTGSLGVETLTAADGVRIYGGLKGQNVGEAVKGAGDVNSDGFDDVLIAGDSETYLLYGKAGAFAFPFQISAFTPADGVRIRAESGAFNSVSDAGDMNGDGVADFILGAPGVETANGGTGAAYVLYGGAPLAVDYSHSDLVTIAKNGRSATFTDTDGDRVTLRVTKGKLLPEHFHLRPSGFGGELVALDLLGDRAFSGTNVIFSAAKQNVDSDVAKEGDARTKIGAILAAGVELGTVTVPGDLGRIDTGFIDSSTGNPLKPAVKLLTTQSFGVFGAATQAAGVDVPGTSRFRGDVARIAVATDVVGVLLSFGSDYHLGALSVGRDFLGGEHGGIVSNGTIGSISIGRDLTGASAADPLVISALGPLSPASPAAARTIGSLTVGGDMSFALVRVGYQVIGKNGIHPDASIGNVLVKGDWTASSLVAGVVDSTVNGFGRNDTLIEEFSPDSTFGTIASVIIRGAVTGSASAGEHFGITADKILRVQLGRAVQPLPAGANDILLDAVNGNFRLVDFQ